MEQIRMTPEQVRLKAKEITLQKEELDLLIQNLSHIVEQMKSCWDDAAQRSFEEKYFDMKPKFEQFSEELQIYAANTTAYANKIDEDIVGGVKLFR